MTEALRAAALVVAGGLLLGTGFAFGCFLERTSQADPLDDGKVWSCWVVQRVHTRVVVCCHPRTDGYDTCKELP